MASVDALKQCLCETIDKMAPELFEASHKIHARPELGFQEHFAAETLTALLAKHGLSVEKPIGDMPTAFRGTYKNPAGGPTIAILGEYDALAGVGHACGHNIIGVAAAAAGIALSRCLGAVPGNVQVIGCPAEEGGGGKILLVERGEIKGVDAAIMTHPMAGKSMIGGTNLATTNFDVKYYGQAAHAAADPYNGINALDAMQIAFHAISCLRQHVTEDVRMHGYIVKGGEAMNVIPDYTEARYLVRAERRGTVEKVAARVKKCFEAGALATGCRVEFVQHIEYAERIVNLTITRVFQQNLRSLGLDIVDEPVPVRGSTDFGLVSQVVPAVNAYVQIAPESVAMHSPEFAVCAKSEAGDRGLIAAAKAMAMTAADLFTDPGVLETAWEEHRKVMQGR